MAGASCTLFDRKWPTRKTRVDADRLLRREHGAPGQLVPNRERKAEVHVLSTLDPVMDAVVVRTAKDAVQRSKAQVRVRVFEGHDRGVDDEQRRRDLAIGDEDDAGDQRD